MNASGAMLEMEFESRSSSCRLTSPLNALAPIDVIEFKDKMLHGVKHHLAHVMLTYMRIKFIIVSPNATEPTLVIWLFASVLWA